MKKQSDFLDILNQNTISNPLILTQQAGCIALLKGNAPYLLI